MAPISGDHEGIAIILDIRPDRRAVWAGEKRGGDPVGHGAADRDHAAVGSRARRHGDWRAATHEGRERPASAGRRAAQRHDREALLGARPL
jgi:hypothetical protein